MKIGIVTQPLLNNYGGIIQNYALQKTLRRFEYEPVTFDCRYKSIPWWVYLCSWLKTILCFFIPGKRRTFAKITTVEKRRNVFEDFVSKNISKTMPVTSLSRNLNLTDKLDAFIAGSDQIWRPKYAPDIEEAFLGFLKKDSVRRVAYAASFGVDEWEYTAKQTRVCSALAKKFDFISVREESGVKLCKEHLGVDAVWVLDPTLLLDESDYLDLCKNVQISSEKYLAAYVLGMNEDVQRTCEKIANEKGLTLKMFSADAQASLSVPEWLAMFRDASYVVTDSFHGTVFSIIFGKEFKCIYNEVRGAARFESLLNLYNSGKLEKMRQFSLNWLKNALET